jgi:hypothetical protein
MNETDKQSVGCMANPTIVPWSTARAIAGESMSISLRPQLDANPSRSHRQVLYLSSHVALHHCPKLPSFRVHIDWLPSRNLSFFYIRRIRVLR